jgi:predicted outer membrane repeat protein
VGPGGYGSINAALFDAVDGDTVEVAPGDYPETLTISKDVDIIGLGGLEGNSLAGFGLRTLTVDGATVSLTGFTIRPLASQGVVLENGASFTGIDLDISGFVLLDGTEGVALSCSDSEVYLEDVIFDANVGDRDGSAIQITDSLAVLTRVTVTNSETGTDGALAADGSDVFVHASHFEANHAADDGGAMDLDADTTTTITQSTFVGNTSEDSAGAINAEDGGSVLIDGCTFESNVADGGNASSDGGALRVRYDTEVEIRNSSFTNNVAEVQGGALDMSEGYYTLADNVFTGNQAALGGALFLDIASSIGTDGDIFESNTADLGGAVYAFEDVDADLKFSSFLNNQATGGRGGAIHSDLLVGSLVVSFSSFSGNTASDKGGALSMLSTADSAYLRLISNEFIGNTAENSGGGVYVEAIQDVFGNANTFCTNDGGKKGGAVGLKDVGVSEWLGNAFVENSSEDFGGGVFFEGSGSSTLGNNTFLANASADGGHLRGSETALDLVNNLFSWAGDGDGVTQSTSEGTRNYNLWFENVADPVGDGLGIADLGPDALFVDPEFVAYSEDGDCANDDLHLEIGSPGIDSGDPSILDRDGSPSDMGAYGGPDGLPPDLDGDGFNALADCDDSDPLVNPDATEECDFIDNNCDGILDGADATGAVVWYPDLDDDGHGSAFGEIYSCNAPSGYVSSSDDCNDSDSLVNPGASEICDGHDQDCDGEVDEGVLLAWYTDEDGDGFGSEEVLGWACEGPAGSASETGDCDDADASVSPAGVEVCDALDNDCDGSVDEDVGQTLYEDADGDGFGLAGSAIQDCGEVDGYSLEKGDCDDTEFDDSRPDCSSKGCGCAMTSREPTGLLLLLGLLCVRRRRRC